MFIIFLFVTISFLAMPRVAEAGCGWNPFCYVAAAVEAVVNTAVALVENVVGGVLSTVGGIFGNGALGCQIVGTNGFAKLYNGWCPDGSTQVNIENTPLTSSNTCDYGGVIANALCVTCPNGKTATVASLCLPKIIIEPIIHENVTLGKTTPTIASTNASLWSNFSETFVRIAKAVGGPYANEPYKLTGAIRNDSDNVNTTTFRNAFYIDINYDNDALQPGVKSGWDLEFFFTVNGIGAYEKIINSTIIRENPFNPGKVGLPIGKHAIIFCFDVDTQIYIGQPLSERCTTKVFKDMPTRPCPDGQAYDPAYDPANNFCQACSNGGCTGPGGNSSNPIGGLICNNGANNPPACLEITSFFATPLIVDIKKTAKLFWSTIGATSCKAGGATLCNDVSGFNAQCAAANSAGATSVALTIDPSSFSITCIGTGSSSATKTTPVTVNTPDSSISANPTRVSASNKTTKITWTSQGVNSCTITRNGLLWKTDLTGTDVSNIISTQTTYTITCQTKGGNAWPPKSVIVNVPSVFREF